MPLPALDPIRINMDSIPFCEDCASKNIRYFSYTNGDFKQLHDSRASSGDLRAFVEEETMPLKLVIANLQKIRDCKPCSEHFESTFKAAFHMPRTWFTEWCRALGCYFGSMDTFNDKDQLDGHNIWFRFDVKQTDRKNVELHRKKAGYQWWKTNTFIRWDARNGHSTILLCDPISFVERIAIDTFKSVLGEIGQGLRPTVRSSPYHIASIFGEHGIVEHDKAVWGIRDLVRESEKKREESGSAELSSSYLHAAMRHHIHVSETLDSTIAIMEDMLTRHQHWIHRHPETDEKPLSKIINTQTSDRLMNVKTILSTLRNRGGSNSDRFKDEIQLALHAVSASIAEANREDSSVMRSLAYLGTAFLPATFVSTLFSMSFFGTDNDGNWTYHPQGWLFWAVSIPVTTVAVFWMWLSRPDNREKARYAAETVAHMGHEHTPPPVQPARTWSAANVRNGARRAWTVVSNPKSPMSGKPIEFFPMRSRGRDESQV